MSLFDLHAEHLTRSRCRRGTSARRTVRTRPASGVGASGGKSPSASAGGAGGSGAAEADDGEAVDATEDGNERVGQ